MGGLRRRGPRERPSRVRDRPRCRKIGTFPGRHVLLSPGTRSTLRRPSRLGVPEVLFEDTCFFRDASYRDFDVTRNGRFLMIKEGSFAAPGQIGVVRNWIEELNERVPVN